MAVTTKTKPEKTVSETLRERFGAQIDEWKRLHGNVFGYVSEDGKCCALRVPSLLILDACRTMSGGNGLKFDMALLENCWLGGDETLKTEDKYRLGVFDWLSTLIQKVEGELEEL